MAVDDHSSSRSADTAAILFGLESAEIMLACASLRGRKTSDGEVYIITLSQYPKMACAFIDNLAKHVAVRI